MSDNIKNDSAPRPYHTKNLRMAEPRNEGFNDGQENVNNDQEEFNRGNEELESKRIHSPIAQQSTSLPLRRLRT